MIPQRQPAQVCPASIPNSPESSLRKIFISYRRSDSEGEAGRLFDDLISRFTEQAVFMDVDAIAPGRDFRRAIEENIHACSVMLAIIGPKWLDCVDSAGQWRLNDEGDFVRIEIATALKRDIPVVPVLVRGAAMMRAEDLPGELKELAFRNAVQLTHARWKSDLQALVQALRPFVDSVAEPAASPLPPSPQAPPPMPAPPAAPLPPAALDQMGKELAHYIGPIAGLVVKRAARQCASIQALRRAVAEEIAAPADRAKFLSKSA